MGPVGSAERCFSACILPAVVVVVGLESHRAAVCEAKRLECETIQLLPQDVGSRISAFLHEPDPLPWPPGVAPAVQLIKRFPWWLRFREILSVL